MKDREGKLETGEIDVIEAAKILKLSPWQIRKRFRAGKIPGRFVPWEKGGGSRGQKLLVKIEEHSAERTPTGGGKAVAQSEKQKTETQKAEMPTGEMQNEKAIDCHAALAMTKTATIIEDTSLIAPSREEIAEVETGNSLQKIRPEMEKIGYLRVAVVNAFRADIASNTLPKTEIIRRFLDAYNTGILHPEIKDALGEISRSTLYSWDRAFREGGVSNLIPNYGGAGTSKITEQEKNYCLSFALNANEFTKTHAISLGKYAMGKRSIPSSSSPATLRRFLDQFEKENNDIWIFKRRGEKALNDNCAPYIQRDWRQLEVGEGLVGDGHTLNFQVINPYTGKPCRPTLVLFWDWRSAYLAGWEIMLTENIQAISCGLRNAILTLGKIPKWVLLDNGKAFRSREMQSKFTLEGTELEGMFARLGINVHFSKAYNAQAKPIERFFRTFNEWFEKMLPSYVGSSIENKPAYLKRNEKYHRSIHNRFIPTIQETNQMLLQWREFYGSQSPKGRDGEKPGEIFSAGKGPGVDPARLIYLMMSAEIRSVNRNGVSWIGRNWWCEGFYGYKGKAVIRYSHADFTQIYAFDLSGNPLGTALPRESVHPMISESENPKDYAEYKRQLAEQARLKKATQNAARLFDSRANVLWPLDDAHLLPDPTPYIKQIEAARQQRMLNPSPFMDEGNSSSISVGVSEKTEEEKLRLGEAWEWYEHLLKKASLAERDQEFIRDYKAGIIAPGEYEAIYGERSLAGRPLSH